MKFEELVALVLELVVDELTGCGDSDIEIADTEENDTLLSGLVGKDKIRRYDNRLGVPDLELMTACKNRLNKVVRK